MPFIGDPRTEFSVTTPPVAGAHVVAVRGELTLATVAELQVALEAAVASGLPVVVDLLEVSFMDSQGLYALLVVRKRLGRVEGAFLTSLYVGYVAAAIAVSA